MRDILFGNHNTKVIKHLAVKIQRADKKRNFFLILAIVFTSFMMASVFSLGIGYQETLKMQKIRFEGSTSHMAFMSPSTEQLEILKNLTYIKDVGLGCTIGVAEEVSGLSPLLVAYVDKRQWDTMFVPAFTDVVGKFPEAEHEIILSRYILSAMGIHEPKIGMEIPMKVRGNGEKNSAGVDFVLSGIYTEYSHGRPGGFVAALTSHSFAKKCSATDLENTTVNIVFKEKKEVEHSIERLKSDIGLGDNQPYVTSPVYRNEVNNGVIFFTLGSVILLFIVTGFFFIYNVMHISISKDVRFYGTLKVLGATPKQVRSIMRRQLTLLCIIGLPIGMIGAAIFSFWLVPTVVKNSGIQTKAVVSFSPLIYIGTILFTFGTVYLGAASPVKKAGSISLIEAQKYTGIKPIKKDSRFMGAKPLVMAVRNILREKKRACIVFFSLFLGLTMFTSLLTILASWDIESRLLSEYQHDASITASTTSKNPYVQNEFVDKVKGLDGIGEIYPRTLEEGEMVYSNALDTYIESVYQEYKAENADLTKEEVKEMGLGVGLRGIDASEMEKICKENIVPFDREAFLSGEAVFIDYRGSDGVPKNGVISVGQSLTLLLGEEKIKKEVRVDGSLAVKAPFTGFMVTSQMEVILSYQFLEKLFKEPHITSVGIDVKKGYDQRIYYELKDRMEADYLMESRYLGKKAMEESRTILYTLGGGISVILGLIGIFNFVNVISVGIITRTQEIAALECIGMSKKQMRKSLGLEGLIYGGITIAASITIGNLVAVGLFYLFQRIEPTARFTYPFLPVLAIDAVILLTCAVVPLRVYASMSKRTLVERLNKNLES